MKHNSVFFLSTVLAGILTTQAALVGHFQLEEGAVDAFTNTVYSTVGGWTGTFQTFANAPTWTTTGLAPVPPSQGGTTASLAFDASDAGSDPYVLTDYAGVLYTNARTIAAWIKPSPNQPNFATFIGYGDNTTGRRVAFRLDPSGFLRLEVSGGAALGTLTKLNDNAWHHVAATIPLNGRASNIVFYVDGNFEPVTVSGPATVINTVVGATSRNVSIGNSPHSPTTYGFNGVVDDVRFYDSVLTENDIRVIIYGPIAPFFSTQPANQKAVLGGANEFVQFAPKVGGPGPIQYQWTKNGGNLPGKTDLNLAIGPVTAADLGDYRLIVTNSFGARTSEVATLSWTTTTLNPVEQTVLVGGTAQFSVSMPAESTGYTYQWKKGGADIAGATGSSYSFGGAALGDATAYTVQVILGSQGALSEPATLHVLAVPASAYAGFVLEDGAAGYWRLGEITGTGTAADITGFHPGSYLGGGDMLGQPGALINDGNTAAGFLSPYYVEVPYSPALNRTASFTVEGWAKPSSATGRQPIIASRTSTRSSGFELLANGTSWQFRTGASSNATVEVWDNLNGGTVTIDKWHHVVGTYDGATKSLYVDGQLIGTQTVPVFATLGTPLRIGADQTYNANAGDFFNGTLDEVAVYWKALTAEQVNDHYLMGVLGSGVIPTITAQPQSTRILLGDTNATAIFTVAASGSPRLRYQWNKGGSPLPGETGFSLVFNPATSDDPGTYNVTVSNNSGSASSTNVTLSYMTGPVTPASQALLAGWPGSFSVSMPQNQPYSYQWKHAGTNLPGATASTLDLPPVTTAAAGVYTVVVTLGAESVESDPASLAVLALPTQGYAQNISNDNPVAWWRMDDALGSALAADVFGINTGSAYPDVLFGAEGSLLGAVGTAAQFTGYSSGGRAGNSKIEVGLNPALNPTVFTVECWAMVSGGSGTFRSPITSRSSTPQKGYVVYAGSDDRWQFWIGDGVGAWSAIVGPPVVENEWAHLVGTYDGASMAFYVNGALVDSGPATYAPNDLYNLRIGAGATEGVTGSFFFPGRIDEVAIYAAALSAAQVQAHYAAGFQPGAAPRITLQPVTRATLAGESYSFSVKAHATPLATYQWQHAGTNIPGANSTVLTLNPVAANSAGTYRAVITDGPGSVNSTDAGLTVLPGQAVSVSIMGFENVRTIATSGGEAGYVQVRNWNEVGYNSNSGTTNNLVNNKGQATPIVATWSAGTNRRWNGPYRSPSGDYALLNGMLDGVTNSVVLSISDIPTSFQSAGYSVYVYLGAPHATAGIVGSLDWYGAVSVGTATNYYHGIDLAVWDGQWVQAMTTDPSNPLPSDANYAVFSGLTAAAIDIVASQHPLALTGPPTISGIQLVANVVPQVALSISKVGNDLVLTWDGDWKLQAKSQLDDSPAGWVDVNATSPYTIPTPLQMQQYYRLRSP